MNLEFGPLQIIAMAATAIVAAFLAALILRSSCDLLGIDPPPHYWRCLFIVVLAALITGPLAGGAVFGLTLVLPPIAQWSSAMYVAACLLALLIVGSVGSLLYMFAFRLRPLRSVTLWTIDFLIRSLVGGVVVMLVVGLWTTVESVRRLF